MEDRKDRDNHLWVYLSPHLDDAVFSCGGLIWEQARQGARVEIWTVCAGDVPPGPLSSFARELHDRWGTGLQAAAVRRAEDEAAAAILGAGTRHLGLPDCIYRRAPGQPGRYLYDSEESLFAALHPLEEPLVKQLAGLLRRELPESVQLVLPLALGNHVDHQLVRRAGQASGLGRWFYPDFPYVLEQGDLPGPAPAWRSRSLPVSEEGCMPGRRRQPATARRSAPSGRTVGPCTRRF